MIGVTVSHYRIISRLGSGGMGVVYGAIDSRLGREVAVKFLSKEFSQDRAAIERFRREARTASALDHPNICIVYDIGEHDGQPFIVMPLLRGQSLKDRIAAQPLKIEELLRYGIPIADALAAAHARRILHRDVKSANIFVTERNVPKLLDFGLAKLATVNRSERSIASSLETTATAIDPMAAAASETGRLHDDWGTEPGAKFGTIAYMSPEQALGDEIDARSDVFSLGVTLYEMATGVLPFKGATAVAVFNEIMTKIPIVPSATNLEIPPDLDELILRALDKDRARRYQTISDVLADLKRVRRALRSTRTGSRRAASVTSVSALKSISRRPVLPTEAINPASISLDKVSVGEIIEMMTNEDRNVVAAVHREHERIAQGIELITQSLRKGGRLVFVGAGTSGRLGVLEATEMPPTFCTPARLVQAVMAGGLKAVCDSQRAVKAEDHYEAGERSMARLRISRKDVVIGVSASGKTPFVRGALAGGASAGAKTIFITCWPGSEVQMSVDLTIVPAVGPEIIAGSTRLKAGTATKMVLNMLTTVSMVRMGKTYGNLMVDLQAGSEKLRERARRIFSIVTGLDYDESSKSLRRAHWNVKAAIVMHRTGLNYAQALNRLKKAQGSIREATGEDIEPRLRGLLRVDRVPSAQQ